MRKRRKQIMKDGNKRRGRQEKGDRKQRGKCVNSKVTNTRK
jgi:hypothetical protein